MELTGKVIAITGGFGNLGVILGARAAAAGAQVALIGRSAAPAARDLPPELSGALLLGKVDVASPEAAREAFAAIAQRFGGLDILVNAAGGFRWQTLADGDLDQWDALYRMNLKTAVAASKAALPLLRDRGGGRIINIGAASATTAGAGMGAYAAAKAGVARLTESLAAEMKDHGINVNAVLPGIIDTPANRAEMPRADYRRWVAPDALADVILFLASDAARAISGALLPVAGQL
ncbi:MAG TPA: SDR family NAD(P)-dependent oxidoreductase [Steroidobacteraceae bacterium]|nr:SDR family NAD(P)-dependent oxidoreductase [Steroidobacteraceae bacterium]